MPTAHTLSSAKRREGRSLCITQEGEVLWQHIYKLPFSLAYSILQVVGYDSPSGETSSHVVTSEPYRPDRRRARLASQDGC